MKGKAAIARILKMEGVNCLTCFPDNPIIDAAAEVSIRPLLTRTERVAVNIADGYSRITGPRQIGVCAVQHGPGAEAAFAGIAQAYADGSPVLLLPEGYERGRLGVSPHFQAVKNYQAVTKWVEIVNGAIRLPQMLRRAFTLLRSGKPGPVLLEVPRDVLEAELPNDEVMDYVPVKSSKPWGDPRDVQEAVKALLVSPSAVIVAGQGVLYAQAWDELKTLAELVQVPVMTTLNGKSCFPENHPLALGTGGRSRPKTVDHFLHKADLIFGIGTSFTRSSYITPIPPGKTMVQVTISEEDINKDYPIAYGVLGDAKNVLHQMIEEVHRQVSPEGRRGDKTVAREVNAVKKEFLEEWLPRLTSDANPISPYRVVWELMHTVDPHRTIVTHDAGNPREQLVPFYEATIPHGYIGWGKTTQLGTGLGLAMGAKLAAPDKLVVTLMGDAAFGMVGMDFETAVRSHIPLLTIVMNNGVMGGYEKQLSVSTARYGTRYLSGRYAGVAEDLGGYAERVERAEALVPALKRAIQEVETGRAALLEVLTREEAIFPTG